LPYYVQIAREHLEFLDSLPHTSAGKMADVLDDVGSYLASATDHFRNERRLKPGSPIFRFDFIFQDDGHLHQLFFYVNDFYAAAGVLVVVFVDHLLGSPI
jgi:hypothetical protein